MINEMEESEVAGKRKKRVNPCPNPLFVQWLTEWRDDAAGKGQKAQYTYAKVRHFLFIAHL